MAWTGGFQRVNNSAVAFGGAETLPGGLAWDGSKLFMVGAENDWLYEVNRTSSVISRVGSAFRFGSVENHPYGLAWDGANLRMAGLENLYTANRTTGAAAHVSKIYRFGQNIVSARDLAWDGTHLYMLGLAIQRTSEISGTVVNSPAESVYNKYRTLLTRQDIIGYAPALLSELRRDDVQAVIAQNPAIINLVIGNANLLTELGVDTNPQLLDLLNTDTNVQNFLRDTDVQALIADLEASLQLQLLIAAEAESAGPYGLIAGLFTVNRNTEIATQVGTLDGFGVGETAPTGLAWDGTDLLMVGGAVKALHTVHRTTGAAKRIGNITAFGAGEDIPSGLGWDGTDLFMSGRRNKALYKAITDSAPAPPPDTTKPTVGVRAVTGEQSETFNLIIAAVDNKDILVPDNITVTASPTGKVIRGPVVRGIISGQFLVSITPVAATDTHLPAEDVDITVEAQDASGNTNRDTVTVRLAERAAPVAPPQPHPEPPQTQVGSGGTQFFSPPLNYGNGRSQYREVADNDYETFTAQSSMLLHIDTAGDGAGTARDFTDIFLKCTGVASYTAAFTDGVNIPSNPSRFPRTPPATVKNDSGDTVDTTVDGYQHDLHNLWTDERTLKPQAKAITLTFTAKTGETPRIYGVMILDRLLTLDSDGGFSRIHYDSLDLGTVEPDLRKRLSYVPPIGGERDKWLVNLSYAAYRKAEGSPDALSDRLIHFIRRYKSFVFAPEYNRYPDRVFPALWPNPETQIRYLSRWKGAGRRVNFTVREA